MPFQPIIMDEHRPSFTASGPSPAVAIISTPSQGNFPTLPEEMSAMFDPWTLAYGVGAPVIPPTAGESRAGTTLESLASPEESANQPVALPRIPSAGRNGVVITTPHPRLVNYPPRIYREGRICGGSSGHRALYLASPLAEPSGTYQIPTTNHTRTMALPENKPPPGSNGRTPYFFTSRSLVERPLAEANNPGRYTNRQAGTGPQLRFQFELREPQQPARPVRRREPVVEILEEDGPKDEVRRDLETNDEEGMDMFYLNGAVLF